MTGGWTYIMCNKLHGVLYVGVTAYLAERVQQHRAGQGSAFCRKYNLMRLVLAEAHATIGEAIVREKSLKAWKRDWKIELIEASNPDWNDLFDKSPETPAFAGATIPPSCQRKLASQADQMLVTRPFGNPSQAWS